MTISAKYITAVLLHFFLFSTPSTADIISLKLRFNNRHMIIFSDFEFSHNGYVSFVISSVTATPTSTSSRPPDPSRIGFVLQAHEVRKKHLEQDTICPLDFELNSVLFTFQDLSHDPHNSTYSFNKSYAVTYPGMYSFFFVNCNEESESLMTMDGRAELYNTDIDGTTKNYLSAGLTRLPFLFFIAAIVYLCFLIVWMLVCFKNRRGFHRVHLLMGGLLVLNFVQIICAAVVLYYVKVTGSPHGLDVLFYTIQLIRSVLLVTVIVLIFTGWCFWKQSLEGKEKLVLTIVIILQVWAKVYSIFAWEAGGPYNKDWINWTEDYSGIGLICGFVIFVPMAFSIISLNKNRDRNAYMNVVKLCLFGAVVGVYMFFTTAVVPVFITLPWMNYGVLEISILVLCMVMFYIFRPFEEEEDEKAVQMDEII